MEDYSYNKPHKLQCQVGGVCHCFRRNTRFFTQESSQSPKITQIIDFKHNHCIKKHSKNQKPRTNLSVLGFR